MGAGAARGLGAYIWPSPTGRGSEPSMPLPSIRRPGGRASVGPAQLTVPGRAGTTGHNGGPGTGTTSCRAWHWHYRHRAVPCSCRAFSDRARAGPSCSCQMATYISDTCPGRCQMALHRASTQSPRPARRRWRPPVTGSGIAGLPSHRAAERLVGDRCGVRGVLSVSTGVVCN
jgi:hypothetical protein